MGKRRGRPRTLIVPGETHVAIDTGMGVIYGKFERMYDFQCCDGDINPYTGEPWDTTPLDLSRLPPIVDPYGDSPEDPK